MRRPTSALIPAALATAFVVLPAPAFGEWTGSCLPQSAGPTCHFWQGKVKWVDDGDTVDVKLATSTGKRKVVRVRITGIQAMEQSVYTRNPRKRKGDCHALPATARLEQLVQRARGTVRLAAQDPASTTGGRLRRSVAVRIRGRWVDVGRVLTAEGHALWLPNGAEWAWNATYSLLTQDAAAEQRNLWNPHACGSGPSQRSTLDLGVNWNPRGNDFDNVNGERVTIENLDLVSPVSLAGWWVRDSALRRYSFPSWAAIPAGGTVTVHMGIGVDTDTTFYWGQKRPVFENPRRDGRGMGDGAYLFDPQGDLRADLIYPCLAYCDQL